MPCPGFSKLMKWQTEKFKEVISVTKYFLSQKAGHDVGEGIAESDVLDHNYYGCATGWRHKYCGELCEHREGCELGEHFIKNKGMKQ